MVHMDGWSSEAAAWAARGNRSLVSESTASSGGRNLSATIRLSLVSDSLYTIPIPPRPSSSRISYRPANDSPLVTAAGKGAMVLVREILSGELIRVPQRLQNRLARGFSGWHWGQLVIFLYIFP